jgi:hypothetical protein
MTSGRRGGRDGAGWWTFLRASTTIPFEKIDPVAKTVSVARETNIFYYAATSNNVFTLENGLPALDRESEWVLDRKRGSAYVLEPGVAKAPVYTITRLAKPMITATDVNNFRIEGLTLSTQDRREHRLERCEHRLPREYGP